jgi:hypothetical protein
VFKTARRRFRRLRLLVVLVAAFVLLTVTVPAVFIAVSCYRPFVRVAEPSMETIRATAGVPNYAREGSATFLTLPARSIVYSSEEYAAFVARRPPSRFPWLGSIGQFWRTYAGACRATRKAYAFDPGAHLRIGMAGVSFSGEQALRGAYEVTLGRLGEWLGGHRTDEDAFARRTAEEYGRFIHAGPWYEFPFATKLRALWRETPLLGPHPARKWERKIFLSTAYGTNAVYARLVLAATGTADAAEDQEIRAWMEDVPADAFADARVKKLRALGPGAFIVGLPRHDTFTAVALGLLRRGASFRDIAGNDVIVLTALGPRDTQRVLPPAAGVVFDERLLTNPAVTRLAVHAPVQALGPIVAALERHGASIEYFYDY